ncbi:MAG: Nramp family divalent metal transporter [Bacteroidetes bacterium]|nr:Nramp family divalent metal transporter [Bacteroidota bacterium]
MPPPINQKKRLGFFEIIGPGILIAATGVGAGDLATATFSGSKLGTAVLWAVLVGGVLKFVLTEGLTRWQLATGKTLLEGAAERLSPIVGWLFLPYLLVWSFFVGAALMSANGVAIHAMVPVFSDPADAKIVFGVAASLIGLGLVLGGGFPLFEKIMGACIALMFTSVVTTAILLWPGTESVVSGLFIPSIPDADGEGLTWTVALMGGIGGTLTILCYGYWIREKNRFGIDQMTVCRIDLGVGYLVTIVFGLAMVIVGTSVQIEGSGADLLVVLSDQLQSTIGPVGKWIFLIGAFGAVFSSLLGVWQAVPYLFADFWRLFIVRKSDASHTGVSMSTLRNKPYRAYLFGIAILPVLGLFMSFKEIQKLYTITGAAFLPLLALGLLILNGRKQWVGGSVNRPVTVSVLLATLVFFGWLAWRGWLGA